METVSTLLKPGKMKTTVAKLLTSKPIGWLVSRFYQNSIPHRGYRICLKEKNYNAAAAIFWEIYESAERRFVEKYLLPDVDVIELGSSLGVISSAAATKLNPGRTLICVEANPKLIPTLHENLAINANNQVSKVYQAAVFYDANEVNFNITDSNLSSSLEDARLGRGSESIIVKAIELGKLISENSIINYQLICDIEGAEVAMFLRDTGALRYCKLIIIEMHDCTYNGRHYSLDDVISLIHNSGDFSLIDRYGPVAVFRREDKNRKL